MNSSIFLISSIKNLETLILSFAEVSIKGTHKTLKNFSPFSLLTTLFNKSTLFQ